MKMYVRILAAILCAALVLAMPFVLSAPNMLTEAKWQLLDEMDGEDSGFVRFLFPAAYAEEGEEVEAEELPEESAQVIQEESPYSLPIDFTPGYAPNPDGYTEAGYEDASIRVQMETREKDGQVYRIAWVEIASPSQLRTAIAGPKVTSSLEAHVDTMAAANNAVVAINGDYYTNDPKKTTYEFRMGEKIRTNTNQKKDMLIIDENGDFHIVLAQKTEDQRAALDALEAQYTIINAFTFGPALVKDGELITTNTDYGYEPNGKTARTAIGQLDTLSYVMVVVEGKESLNKGITQQQLANFMYELGCRDAFNLDGGGSSYMYYDGEYYNVMMAGHREISDIIYFATAVPTEEWRN